MSETIELSRPAVGRVPAAPAMPSDHPPVAPRRIGVLLMNLGTPEGTGYWPMRRYLKEFLSDRRVIETPRLLWWPLLNLDHPDHASRPARAATTPRSGTTSGTRARSRPSPAPRPRTSRRICKAIGGDRVVVDWAMRYGKPEVRGAHPGAPRRRAATASCWCRSTRNTPPPPRRPPATRPSAPSWTCAGSRRVRVSPPYHDDPVYIDALARSMRKELAQLDFEPEVILVSFHGVPKEYLLKGDPYHCHCVKTWRLLREAFGWPDGALPHELPVPLRPGRVAAALHGRDREGPGRGRREAHRHRRARASPPIASRPWRSSTSRTARSSSSTAASHSPICPASTTATDGMRVIRHVVERELQGWL